MEDITIFNLMKYVRNALLESEKLTELVDSQIFVMEGKEGVHFPFITVTKNGASEERNKDYLTGFEASINITIWHNKYATLCDIAQEVYDAMEKYFMKIRTTPLLSDNWDDIDPEDGCWMTTLQYTFKL